MSKSSESKKALDQALTDYKVGNFDEALLTLASATIDEDDYLDFAYLLGLCYVRLQKYDEALLYLEQLVTTGLADARAAQCRFMLAYIYSITGRSKLAEYELKKLIEENGETAKALAALGYVCWAQGRKQEALDWYKKAVVVDPENINALNGCGYVMACLNNELPRALRYCEKAYKGDPKNPAYADSLGWVYFKLNRLEPAAIFIGKAARMLSNNSEIVKHVTEIRKKARK